MRTGLKSSNTASLRVAVGGSGKSTVDENFIPYLADDGTFSLPKWNRKSFAIGRKAGSNTTKFRHALVTTNIVSHKLATQVLPTRSACDVLRWMEEWEGIIDSLLLFDLNLFNEENRGLLRFLFRKVFHIAMFNVDLVTSHWKEFTSVLWNNVSKQFTLEDVRISERNPFRKLLAYGPIIDLQANGLKTKLEATAMAHLLSTRQMVPGGVTKQVAALDKFVETTSVPFVPTEVNSERARIGATYVGKKVSSRRKKTNLTALCHISLSTAGDVDFSKINGGRGAAIQEDISKILTDFPSQSGYLDLPFGISVREEQGVPRYATWGRPENLRLKKKLASSDPRWKARFVWSDAPVYGFGQPRQDYDPEVESGEYALEGYDSYLGVQIFYAALLVAFNEGYLDLQGNPLKPVPARTSVVPEPGGKARIITVTKWWLIILQQPFGHLTKSLLSGHPSAEAGLKRADQAWLYLDLLHKVKPLSNGYVLSSDLEEATDAISPDVAETMIRGFYRGVGYTKLPKLIEIGIQLGLRSTREIEIQYPRSSGRKAFSFIKRRGVLMGEPVTKSVLTLYSLVCEEMAIRDYLYHVSFRMPKSQPRPEAVVLYKDARTNCTEMIHARSRAEWIHLLEGISHLANCRMVSIKLREKSTDEFEFVNAKTFRTRVGKYIRLGVKLSDEFRRGQYSDLKTYTGPVTSKWRAFAVGGDDHIAYGPVQYLELITSNHFAFGSKISLPKHGFSNVAVKFCEKILMLRGRDLSITPRQINQSSDFYEKSVWVDSIKVRLLSPLSKSMDVEDDRNIAIGKSRSLSRSLEWLNPDFFADAWCDLVLARFSQRMYPYLPKPIGKDRSLWFQLKLPPEYGGLGLKFKNERLQDIIMHCPKPTRAYLKQLVSKMNGDNITIPDTVVRSFKRLCTANSARGIKSEYDSTEEILLKMKPKDLQTLRAELDLDSKLPIRLVLRRAQAAGYYPMDRAVEQLSRCFIFLDALRGRKRESYKTVSWRNRYWHLWKVLDAEPGFDINNIDLSSSELDQIANSNPVEVLPVRFYNLYEAVADLAPTNLSSGPTSIRSQAASIALLLAKSRTNTAMASAAVPLIEKVSRMLPDLNLRLDFDGNRVEKVRLEPVFPSLEDLASDNLSESDELPPGP
jgi:hypothetical protein